MNNTTGVEGCTIVGADFNWSSSCETYYGVQIWPFSGSSEYSGYPSQGSWQLEPYSLNTDYYVVVYGTKNGLKLTTSYTIARKGGTLAVNIESPDGSKWASKWFAIP